MVLLFEQFTPNLISAFEVSGREITTMLPLNEVNS